MTEPIFFDTDCLSAFLWVDEQSLLPQLFPGRIIIPQTVYDELLNSHVTMLINRINILIGNGQVELRSIEVGSEEYEMFEEFTQHPAQGYKVIDDGEAEAIALAINNDGILASNNLKDVMQYVKDYSIKHITTGEILKEALDKYIISEEEGNTIWSEMLRRRRWLGADSFTEYLRRCE